MIDWRAHIEESDDAPAVVRGAGVTVEKILGMLADGQSVAQIAALDPRLSEDAIRACLEYSLELVARQRQIAIVRKRIADAEAYPERLVSHEDVMRRMKQREAELGIAEEGDE